MLKKVYILVELLDRGCPDENEKALWTELLESYKSSSVAKSPQKNVYTPAGNVSIARTYFIKFISFCNLCLLRCQNDFFTCFCNSKNV